MRRLDSDEIDIFSEILERACTDGIQHVQEALKNGAFIPSLYEPPRFDGCHENGMPRISIDYFNVEKDYASLFFGNGLVSMLTQEVSEIPSIQELSAWVRKSGPMADYFRGSHEDLFDWQVKSIVPNIVGRYIHLHGTGFNQERLRRVVAMVVNALTLEVLPLTLAVPIAMARFEPDRQRLSSTSYLARMGKPFQLARSKIEYYGGGVHDQVKKAATHALIWTGWSMLNENYNDSLRLLSSQQFYPQSDFETFFAALRAATGIEVGYAQMLAIPRGWAFSFYWDLPVVHGVTIRRYPSRFDDYGWFRGDLPTVASDQLEDVSRVFSQLEQPGSRSIALAAKRLNACYTRDDPEDAILDASIGLELLLGDSESQAVSYKLRMRAAALARIDAQRRWTPEAVLAAVGTTYEHRSAIAHGNKRKSKRLSEPSARADAALQAAELLRLILDILLQYPAYQDPSVLDRELLLGLSGDHAPVSAKDS